MKASLLILASKLALAFAVKPDVYSLSVEWKDDDLEAADVNSYNLENCFPTFSIDYKCNNERDDFKCEYFSNNDRSVKFFTWTRYAGNCERSGSVLSPNQYRIAKCDDGKLILETFSDDECKTSLTKVTTEPTCFAQAFQQGDGEEFVSISADDIACVSGEVDGEEVDNEFTSSMGSYLRLNAEEEWDSYASSITYRGDDDCDDDDKIHAATYTALEVCRPSVWKEKPLDDNPYWEKSQCNGSFIDTRYYETDKCDDDDGTPVEYDEDIVLNGDGSSGYNIASVWRRQEYDRCEDRGVRFGPVDEKEYQFSACSSGSYVAPSMLVAYLTYFALQL